MSRFVFILFMAIISTLSLEGREHIAVVADSATRAPLPSASIFNHKGRLIGICTAKGKAPYISPTDYPITVRYLGYRERQIQSEAPDTIFLHENPSELPEVVISAHRDQLLHMLAYVREYSTLSTYTDTIFLFREKMVDYMLNNTTKFKFKGWTNPRILKTKSYYHFTNASGLDSVSNVCNHYFSWSDWIGVAGVKKIPQRLIGTDFSSDTLRGKYSPTEVWLRKGDRMAINVDVLADTVSRKWVPNLSSFFHMNLDFDYFKIKYNYGDIVDNSVTPVNMTGYSFNIESTGRGREMFMFNKINEPYFVSTYAEVYFIDKEYVTLKEAKKWRDGKFKDDEIDIYEPTEAPELTSSIQNLINRVDGIDIAKIRSSLPPDQNLVGKRNLKISFGKRVLSRLKRMIGIRDNTAFRSWEKFKKAQIIKNRQQNQP